jgi:hypothetical protein
VASPEDSPVDFGLKVQLLPHVVDRVLVLGEVAGLRNLDRWFTPGDVSRLFQDLRLPPPGNISQSLKRLEERGFARRRSGGGWSLTPTGRRGALDAVGDIDPMAVDAEIRRQSGAEYGHVQHSLIPPSLAPQRWLPAIGSLLERFEFSRNVFCMTRFPGQAGGVDPMAAAISAARDITAAHGLVLHLASDRALDDDLWGNVVAHMWACNYGLALFEERTKAAVNDNVLIEVGSMLVSGRRCALLRDRTVKSLPTDFVGQLYKSVDFDDVASVSAEIHRWIANDLALGRCPTCPA